MEYLSVTFPSDLKKALDKEAKRGNIKRSTLIQKAVRIYLHLRKQEATKCLLRDGYKAMYEVSKKITDDFEVLERKGARSARFAMKKRR